MDDFFCWGFFYALELYIVFIFYIFYYFIIDLCSYLVAFVRFSLPFDHSLYFSKNFSSFACI